MKDPFPGVRQYLETEESKRGDWNRSQYNRRANEVAAWAIEYLILFCEGQTERELAEVLTDETVDRLASTFLTQGRKQSRSKDKDHQELIEREYRIAAMFMGKGAAKCLEAFERKEQESPSHLGMDSPLYRLVEREALTAVSVLNYVAAGVGGVDADYHFHADRYKPKPAQTKRERPQGHRNSP